MFNLKKKIVSVANEKNYGTKLSWSVNILYISANHLVAFSAFATHGECNLQSISINTICIRLEKQMIFHYTL